MQSFNLLRGASAFALASTLVSSAALAQTQLPKIEVGAAKPRRAVARPAPVRVAAPPAPAPVPAPAPEQPPPPSLREAPVTSSSSRTFTAEEVTARPYSQPSEALEIVPGLVVTQHSGTGKANQYFLRGFALDHGNDLGLTIDGMPINMPTHAHGQGYADANFIIPELFSSVDVRKGPFFADEGAFASAGAVHMQYVDKLEKGLFSGSGGSFGWGRLLGAKSWALGEGELLAAGELNHYDGPWQFPDDAKKVNGVVRWSRGTQDNGLSFTGMAYSNHWNATEEIPQHVFQQGLISRWDNEDPSDHGNAERYSLSGRWSETDKDSSTRIEAYAIRGMLNLWSDSTLFLEHPILGDQFHHPDRRTILGANALHGWNYRVADLPIETRVGVQGRYDFIRNGLEDSFIRNPFDVPRDDYIKEGSIAPWTDTTVHWTPWLRTTVGGRLDYWAVDVRSIQTPFDAPVMIDPDTGIATVAFTGPFNSGSKTQTLFSPKAGLVLGPFDVGRFLSPKEATAEFFLNGGEGLQSSDGRATVERLDPKSGSPFGESGLIQPVPLLIKTRGAEAGVRAKEIIEGLDSTLSLFFQDFDSENLFEGETGTTVSGRPSRRYGFEWTNKYSPYPWLHFDSEVTATHARFLGGFDLVQAATFLANFSDPLFPLSVPGAAPGNFLINAPEIVATGGVEMGEKTGWFGALHYRYFGARALTEDGFVTSHPASTLAARVGYRFDNGWKVQLDAFNITNNRGDAVAFGFPAFAKSDFLFFGHPETAFITERQFKTVDPPAVRVTLSGPLVLDGPGLFAPSPF